jgi:spastin
LNGVIKPKRMTSVVERREVAITKLRHATALEHDGKLADASAEYSAGLELLLGTIKVCHRPEEKTRLTGVFTTYMNKAEALKARITGRPIPVVRTNSHGSQRLAQKAIPAKQREAIESEILDSSTGVTFDDVVGLDDVKQALHEAVILPALRPDLFQGLRQPPKGVLVYGPPGNGKTFIAKAVANESKATFFSISASSLVSQYLGEGEQRVRALFAIARERAPSIIFVDEIDSILSKRSDKEHEASRRLKTEFLVQLDGVATDSDSGPRVLVIGATNMPQELDDAILRRMPRRIYVGPPDAKARMAMLDKLLRHSQHNLTKRQMTAVVKRLENYSGSDIRAVWAEASMGPIRDLDPSRVVSTQASSLTITFAHFKRAADTIQPTLTSQQLQAYRAWQAR